MKSKKLLAILVLMAAVLLLSACQKSTVYIGHGIYRCETSNSDGSFTVTYLSFDGDTYDHSYVTKYEFLYSDKELETNGKMPEYSRMVKYRYTAQMLHNVSDKILHRGHDNIKMVFRDVVDARGFDMFYNVVSELCLENMSESDIKIMLGTSTLDQYEGHLYAGDGAMDYAPVDSIDKSYEDLVWFLDNGLD